MNAHFVNALPFWGSLLLIPLAWIGAIMGGWTVLLVFLMSLVVVPLGVVTAVYMTEYARAGVLLRLANQAVNNLAGVPSIVFGMFGLAFFIYGVGGTVDRDRDAGLVHTWGGRVWGVVY